MKYNKQLLTFNNAKTVKGENVYNKKGLPYKTAIMYLSSYTNNSKGINLCSHASTGCAATCLVGSGNGGMFPKVMQGRIDKTEYFLRDRIGFMNQLDEEITNLKTKFKLTHELVVRLNGTADIVFEKFKIFEGKNIFEKHSDITFYDYTKNHTRFEKALPSNYHLTFSRSETNHAKAIELLNKGKNVAIVFDKLPSTYEGFEVISGDEDDLTFLKPKGVILGLKYKFMTGKGGGEKNKLAFSSGFVVKTQTLEEKLNELYSKVGEKEMVLN